MEKPVGLDERRMFWEQHVRDWKSSGMSQVQYCRQNKISQKSFVYWKCKLLSTSAPAHLVEVQVSSLTPVRFSSNPVRLLVGDRYRIEIEKDFDPSVLEQLLNFLGRR